MEWKTARKQKNGNDRKNQKNSSFVENRFFICYSDGVWNFVEMLFCILFYFFQVYYQSRGSSSSLVIFVLVYNQAKVKLSSFWLMVC